MACARPCIICREFGGVMSNSRYGFSLAETLIALLMLSMAAMLMLRSSAANALVMAQTMKAASAVRFASEFSAWVNRGGHTVLGMSLDEALAQSDAHRVSCDDGGCSAEDGAWHYLSRWRERVFEAIPDAQIMICTDSVPVDKPTGWHCDAGGSAWVMKLGWRSGSVAAPAIVLELMPSA